MSTAVETVEEYNKRLEQLACRIAYNNGYADAKRREVQAAMKERCQATSG